MRVSERNRWDVGWLAEVFPLLYVALAIPAGMALDRWFVPALRVGAASTAAGALVRFGGDAFAWALAGQMLVAVGQPFVLNAVTKVASGYVAPPARPAAIALGTGGQFAGLLLGLALGPALGSAEELGALLWVEAAFGVLAATALWTAVRARPAGAAANERTIGLPELRAVWDDRLVRVLCALAFVGFGIFIALTTWLQGLLEPFGVSDDTAGAMLVAAVVAGVLMTSWLPAATARRGAERSLLTLALLACGACCAALAAVRTVGMQFALALPVGALVHRAGPAFGLLALAAAAGLPFARRLDARVRPPASGDVR